MHNKQTRTTFHSVVSLGAFLILTGCGATQPDVIEKRNDIAKRNSETSTQIIVDQKTIPLPEVQCHLPTPRTCGQLSVWMNNLESAIHSGETPYEVSVRVPLAEIGEGGHEINLTNSDSVEILSEYQLFDLPAPTDDAFLVHFDAFPDLSSLEPDSSFVLSGSIEVLRNLTLDWIPPSQPYAIQSMSLLPAPPPSTSTISLPTQIVAFSCSVQQALIACD